MPRVHRQTARNDIYRYGKKVPSDKTKSGFRLVSSKPRDESDEVIIQKGQTYYMWSFPFGGTYKQLTPPRRSQLTRSEFLGQMYDLEDSVMEFTCNTLEELETQVEEWKSELESIRDEQEEKRDNMPESLQESFSGELLQERYDALEDLINELDCIDFESQVEEAEEEAEDADHAQQLEEEYLAAINQEVQEKLEEVQEAFSNISY